MDAIAPWFWRSLPLENRQSADIFATLFIEEPIAVLLASAETATANPKLNRYSICAGQPRSKQGQLRQWSPPLGQVMDHLHQFPVCGAGIPTDVVHLPFTGGWLGWLGYDLAWEIESLPYLKTDPLPFPVSFWYEPSAFAVLDHDTQQLWLAASSPADLDHFESKLAIAAEPYPPTLGSSTSLHIHTSQAQFEASVRAAQRYIAAGDIFQANLSLRFSADSHDHPWQLYCKLQQLNPSPFASYWQTPWGWVVSCSPERLICMRDRIAQVRPIAGTRPRGTTPAADAAYAQALQRSPKERAEHTMLVDLERNDLGKVCRWGSVVVDELFTIERYSHVMHLVSNVQGQVQPGSAPADLIRAVFPGGTITGCPKVRCMEIIEALEPDRRSLFYGSCGYLDQRGHLDLNILIRTLLATQRSPAAAPYQIWGQVGAGIVADSHPTHEWHESLQKAKAQWEALSAG